MFVCEGVESLFAKAGRDESYYCSANEFLRSLLRCRIIEQGNSTYFTNTAYHPAPGGNIARDRYLEVVVKTGVANAYTFSINSPAVVLYRAQGMTMREWVQTEGAVIPIPGGSTSQVAAVPLEWIVDAVEVFSGTSSSNSKRLPPSLDAGYVTLSDTYLGHTLFRRTDEELSASAGYEVLKDTNNSSVDFYERESQSLHE